MRIVCISDTHNKHHRITLPPGDILVHTGDFSNKGTLEELIEFHAWFSSQPHRYKIMIAGNHDFCFENQNALARSLVTDAIYLQDEEVKIEGVSFYGSPWQPWFLDWAFNLPRQGEELRNVWDKIPLNTDVLLTHSPVYGRLDRTIEGEHVGCEELMKRIDLVRPQLHVCGHIHESYGIQRTPMTSFINASICDIKYRPIHPPIVYDL